MKDKSPSEIKFSGPGIYQIQVIGEVSQEIWNCFDGETEQTEEVDGQVVSSLKIRVRDQAELAGSIKLLYEWQHVLLLVKMERQDEKTEVERIPCK